MLSTLASLPLSAISSTANFFTSRKRGFAYAAATVGSAYVAGKWALSKVGESAEKARKEGWGRDESVCSLSTLSWSTVTSYSALSILC
jgi:hypothetical protein